jgi:integrase
MHRERKQGEGKLKKCGVCKGVFLRKYFRRHEKECEAKQIVQLQGIATSPKQSLSVDLLQQSEDDPAFTQAILEHFADDEAGRLCRNDTTLRKIGTRMFQKERGKPDKRLTVRNTVRNNMRRLAGLYLEMASFGEGQFDGVEALFKRENMTLLEKAITNYTTNEETKDAFGQPTIKAGLKKDIYYLIKGSAHILRGECQKRDDDEGDAKLEKFDRLFEHEKHRMFGDADYIIMKNRLTNLRCPSRLPTEAEVTRLHDFIDRQLESMDEYLLAKMDLHKYKDISELINTRVTLFNGRRGGEPSRMLLSQLRDAENDLWVPEINPNIKDPLEQHLLTTTKIAYMGGKGKGKNSLVSVLLPEDTMKGLRILADEQCRKDAGINPQNPYVFPLTENSLGNRCGWKALQSVAEKAQVPKDANMTATAFRHRISTLYAAMDVPADERNHMYTHLGHSEQMNKDMYQAPLAVIAITKIGKRLRQLQRTGIPAAAATSETIASAAIPGTVAAPVSPPSQLQGNLGTISTII